MAAKTEARDGLVRVIETIIGATGYPESVLKASLGAGDVIDSVVVFSYSFDDADGIRDGYVSNQDRLDAGVLDRIGANMQMCPIDEWHRAGHESEIAVLSQITDPGDYRRTDHYARIFGESGIADAMCIPFGSNGDTVRVLVCRDKAGFSDADIETARLLQPVLHGCLDQSRAMEKLRLQPLSEEAMRERGLTAREAQIFSLLAAGSTSQMVGEELGISVRTVEKHVQNIYSRLGARNRSEAISILLGNSSSVAAALLLMATPVVAAL